MMMSPEPPVTSSWPFATERPTVIRSRVSSDSTPSRARAGRRRGADRDLDFSKRLNQDVFKGVTSRKVSILLGMSFRYGSTSGTGCQSGQKRLFWAIRELVPGGPRRWRAGSLTRGLEIQRNGTVRMTAGARPIAWPSLDHQSTTANSDQGLELLAFREMWHLM